MVAQLDHNVFERLRFDNRFIRELPADPEHENYRREVTQACFSRVHPQTVAGPRLVAYSAEVAALIGLAPSDCLTDAFAAVFSGNQILAGMEPFACNYGGHQFGQWAGQLGDGRAINLGEVINAKDERWMLQLKGAGPTPYSRGADGLAVLRSSVREFLCSEAMHHLGVPTTRALSIVETGEGVLRDMFYDGHPCTEPGAVVCRVAPSFTRFGNFQLFSARGEHDVLKALVDYTITVDFPHLGPPSRDCYLDWLREVCRLTAEMVVTWMRVGFVHGVMNTDNMSILGLTIDYGPYGWLEDYDPDWTPNTTDAHGKRYRFAHQAQMALWNLAQLANAIVPLVEDTAPLEEALGNYAEVYQQQWRTMIVHKLGLDTWRAEDDALFAELAEILQSVETDMTIFYRALATVDIDPTGDAENDIHTFADAYYVPAQLDRDYRAKLNAWLRAYRARCAKLEISPVERQERMRCANPKYVLRNYLAQLAIDKAEAGDYSLVAELLELLRRPYDEQIDKAQYAVKRPDWARSRAGCSMLSCSS